MTKSCREKGVGLIEVMVALVVLMVAAGAIVNMQSNSLVSAHSSGIHFSIDRLSSEMIEFLRSNSSDAAAGLLDLSDSESTVSSNSESIVSSNSESTVSSNSESTVSSTDNEVTNWNDSVAELLPSGEGQISCTPEFCDVTVSWMEEIDGSNRRQFYNTRTRI